MAEIGQIQLDWPNATIGRIRLAEKILLHPLGIKTIVELLETQITLKSMYFWAFCQKIILYFYIILFFDKNIIFIIFIQKY
jgi:hypothetical protein